MNTLIIETNKAYVFKNIEDKIVVLPESWDCEYVNVVLWEKDLCSQSDCTFTIRDCGELLLKPVLIEEDVKTIELEEYLGEDVLIVQI